MKIVFRVDASVMIGTGHVMRCITFANTLKKQGANIYFVCRERTGDLTEYISSLGFSVYKLPYSDQKEDTSLKHANWLGTSQLEDARQTALLINKIEPDWIVVDHYGIDLNWESSVRNATKRIMVIDDLADRTHDCDVLLDQNYYADMEHRYRGKVPDHCKLLLGPRYALLREEFYKVRQISKSRTNPVRRILVFFGGIDLQNSTRVAIQALSELRLEQIAVDVVIGKGHPDRAGIEHLCTVQKFQCHVQTSKMAELMVTADLAIGAGGSAMLERCALGLPSIVLILAENQRKSAEDLHESKAIICLGDARDVTQEKLKDAIQVLISNDELRLQLSLASRKIVPLEEQFDYMKLLSESYV